MNAKRFIGSVMLAILGGIAAVIIYDAVRSEEKVTVIQETPRMRYINLPRQPTAAPSDFTVAAEIAVDAVVHVKTKAFREGSGNPLFDYFFGYREYGYEQRVNYGSGVILTSDGYIVTNNHVIEGSQEVEVILNDKYDRKGEVIYGRKFI